MLFVVVEDGTLEVVADLDEACRRYEPIDVESGVFLFFDERGRPLEPVFLRPNRQTRWLGLFTVLEQGVYELAPSTDPTREPFLHVLSEVAALEPNPWFRSLDAVRQFITAAP